MRVLGGAGAMTTLMGAVSALGALGALAMGCGGGGGGGGGGSAAAAYGLEQRETVQGLTFPGGGGGGGSPTLTLERAFPNLQFTQPIYVSEVPDGSGRLVVVEQAGRILAFPNQEAASAGQVQTFLDIRGRVSAGGEEGLLGLAFAPDYATSGQLFVHYSAAGPRRSVIARFQRSAVDPQLADPASEELVLSVAQPFSNHNAGMLAFGPDGMLYVALGDGGSGDDPQGHGQDLGTLLGALLRIDVRTRPYVVPADNPFLATPGARGEIWAYGLRNPFRFSFDRQTGELWLGDVGQGRREEIDLVTRGANLGWRLFEGSLSHLNPGGVPASSVTAPVLDYDRSRGASVIGGYVYRGARTPSLQGAYLYADYVSGQVRLLRRGAGGAVSQDELLGTLANPSSFGEDAAGEVLIVSHQGTLWRVVDGQQGGGSFPQRLSQTGLFRDTAALTPAPGLVEYEVNVPFWSDGALKRRWIALPGTSSAGFAASGAWTFPPGTVLVKHFEVDAVGGRRRLETRVLIHEVGGWAGYTYVWDPNGLDATLDAGAGTTIPVQLAAGAITYPVPSRAQCLACHAPGAGSVLGVRTEQLARTFTYPNGVTDDQLRAWGHVGLVSPDPSGTAGLVALPRANDAGAGLEPRARAYLAANCAHCHQPGGPAAVGIDLRFQTPLAASGLLGVAPTRGDLGLANPALIRAGSKESSVLWERLRRRDGTTQMPPLASHRVDQAAVDLIGQWIDGL